MGNTAENLPTGPRITAQAAIPTGLIAMAKAVQDQFGNEQGILDVTNPADLDYIRESILRVKGVSKEIDVERKELTKPFRDAATEINDLFRSFTEWADEFEKSGKAAMGRYQMEQERVARAAQAAADAKARKEREQLEARARAAAEKGQVEKAEALAENAETVVAVVKASEKIKGQSYKWVVEITDTDAFLKHAVNDVYMKSTLKVDLVALTKIVGSINDETLQIPGTNIGKIISFAMRK